MRLAIAVTALVLALVAYPYLPEQVPSHWDAQGNVDGHTGRFWGAFFLPLVTLGVYFLFLAVPMIDPLKKNIGKFREHYDMFVTAIMLFLLYVYALTLMWSTLGTFNMTQALMPAFAVLAYCIGLVLKKAQRNWFVGIRTPWTLSSDRVWKQTHALGSKLFKISAGFILLGTFLPAYGMWFLLAPLLGSSLALVVYSYVAYVRAS